MSTAFRTASPRTTKQWHDCLESTLLNSVRRGSLDPAETDDLRSPLLVFFLYDLAVVRVMNIRRPIADGYLHAGA